MPLLTEQLNADPPASVKVVYIRYRSPTRPPSGRDTQPRYLLFLAFFYIETALATFSERCHPKRACLGRLRDSSFFLNEYPLLPLIIPPFLNRAYIPTAFLNHRCAARSQIRPQRTMLTHTRT
ncbi:hypothetical protein MRX96_044475 [Rhipicephalus microplus]